MHGVGFPNATDSVHTDRHERRSLTSAPPAHAAPCVRWGPRGLLVVGRVLHEEQGRPAEMQPIQTPASIFGEGFYYTSRSLSTV